jgi:hypothetical protein
MRAYSGSTLVAGGTRLDSSQFVEPRWGQEDRVGVTFNIPSDDSLFPTPEAAGTASANTLRLVRAKDLKVRPPV